MTTSVFVSGATGFIAQHVVQQLIQKGYKVVGTVRSTEKGDRLKANLKSDNFEYEIVKDIAEEHAFDEALKKHPEVTVFLHTASPFHFNVTDVQKDLLDPAVKGTTNALSSIKKYGPQIKKVVVTSSYAAVAPPIGVLGPEFTVDETSWNPTTLEEALSSPGLGYRGSKTFAERAAWAFLDTEKPTFTLNTVNPSFVFGPQVFDSEVSATLNTSSEVLNSFTRLSPTDDVPVVKGGYVDVRDVARAHLHAFESDVTGFRYLLSTGPFVGQDIIDVIRDNIPQLKDQVPKGVPGSGAEEIKKLNGVDNSKTAAKIGPFIDLKKTVVDSIEQILAVNSK
ncbi:Glycine-rich RNA-binding protein 2, mitochondrial [Yamadazyma tenuis]|uniref:NAD(P)-binding protein n=1 Tax=Candida tenuis (strain ATCC 10573 / BCRC 21748 / CBS 615 / JCM 9827 / NBRC 10315 / NRRL Y-1498 / VKM Y-70) TaxID=590646 RepID=G3B1N5_CANTC|nr:NAD(P)-binding protein [Yamadazyma tenuis ATCC 10573]XP_006685801.1 uncharacterized protein CANTEDRAFT_113256 [Yamadazyma tenuis ATCC 10573]EGV64994.1 NAD(P)-binding protein [Yamadazyma tenuis ATCC 10573]EGV64995.1 hypothetical protein CANTEDRAFT_113256 [Yamadazyma tenuis ATCC 10573]WEJ97253.1 Glycine-rich RNA-binding protein 2, mitochondrial [Yamadazyma tenuis]